MRLFRGLLLIALVSGKRKRDKKDKERTNNGTMECTETMNCDDGSFCAINQGESGSCSSCPSEEVACEVMPGERAIVECKQFCFGDFSNDDDSGFMFTSEKKTCKTDPTFKKDCEATCNKDTDTCTCVDTPTGPYCRRCKHSEIGYGDTKLCAKAGGIYDNKCWSGPEGGCRVPCLTHPERYGDCKCVTTDFDSNVTPSKFGQRGTARCVYCPAGKTFVPNWGNCNDDGCEFSNNDQCAKGCTAQGLARSHFEEKKWNEEEKKFECGKCHCCQDGQFFKEDGTCYWPSLCNTDTEESCKNKCDHTKHGDCQCFHQAAGDICMECPLGHEFDLHPDVEKCVPTTGTCMSWEVFKKTIDVYCPPDNGFPPKNGWTCGFYSNDVQQCPNGESIGIKCMFPASAANDHRIGAHCKKPGNGQWSMGQWLAPQCSIETAQTCAEECKGDDSMCICEAQFETGQREDVCVDTCEDGKFFLDGKCFGENASQCDSPEWKTKCPDKCVGTSKHDCKCVDDFGSPRCSECQNGEWRYGNTELCVRGQVEENLCTESSKARCNKQCGDKNTFGDCKCISEVAYPSGKPVNTDICVYCPKDETFGVHDKRRCQPQKPDNQCANGRYPAEGACHSDCLSGMWSWTAPSAENAWCGECTCCKLSEVIDDDGKCFKPEECTSADRHSCEATCIWQLGKYGSCTCLADIENKDNSICVKCQIGESFDPESRRCKLNEKECISSAKCHEHCAILGGGDYNCAFFANGPEAAKCDKESEFKGRCRVCRKPKVISWYGGSQIPFCGEPQGNFGTGLFCSDKSMDMCAKECSTGEFEGCHCVSTGDEYSRYDTCKKCPKGEMFHPDTDECVKRVECFSSEDCILFGGGASICNFDFGYGGFCEKCSDVGDEKSDCDNFADPKGAAECEKTCVKSQCNDYECAKECSTGEFEGCHCGSTGDKYSSFDICKKCPKGEMFHPVTGECVKRPECSSSDDCGDGSICNFDFGYGGFCEMCSDLGDEKSDCEKADFINPKGTAECEKHCVKRQCKDSENVANKPEFCTDVTTYYTKTNSWVCKNCFNVRIEFNLGRIGAVGHWWDNMDQVVLAFKEPVSVIKAQGPVESVEALKSTDAQGYYRFKVTFNANAQFGDRRIDVNIEFNDLDNSGELAWAKACPCGVTPCSDKWMDLCANECITGEFEGCQCVSTGDEDSRSDTCKKCPKGEMFHPVTGECVKRIECFSSDDCGGGSICNFDFGYGGFCEKCSDLGDDKSHCDNFADPKGTAECEKFCFKSQCKDSECAKECSTGEFEGCHCVSTGDKYSSFDICKKCPKGEMFHPVTDECVKRPECFSSQDCGGGSICNFDFGYGGFCEKCSDLGDQKSDCDNFIDPKGAAECEKTCVKRDICDPAGITITAPGGYWKCSSNARSNVQSRMNKCVWMCYGDDFYVDDYSTGAKTRCFRGVGKKKERRELGKWIMGRNSADRVKCTKKKN